MLIANFATSFWTRAEQSRVAKNKDMGASMTLRELATRLQTLSERTDIRKDVDAAITLRRQARR